MYKQITLKGFVNSPIAWQNFVRMVYDESKHLDAMTLLGFINESLREFDAQYVMDKTDSADRKYYITFDNEQGYILFLLMYS